MSGSLLQRLGAGVASLVGRQHPLVQAARPAYEALLDIVTLGRGFQRTVNGTDRFNVDPRLRHLFPEIYEPAVWAFLRSRVKPGDVVLNVGAHVGLYTLGAAAWSAPGGRVVAFEPNPATRLILEDHVRRNGAEDRVEVIAAAAGASESEASFAAEAVEGTSRIGEPNPESRTPATMLTVRVTTIDAVCRERALKPAWIIMDVEGLEGDALEGARSVLAGAAPPGVVVEFHPHLWRSAGWSRARMEELVASHALVPVPIAGQRDPWTEAGVVFLSGSSERHPAA